MFVNSTLQVGITQRVVATLVACAVLMTSIGVYNTAQAANLSTISNTLSNSNPGDPSVHTISFVVPTGSSIAPGDDITVTFDTQDEGLAGQDFAGGDISSAISDSSDITVEVNTGGAAAPTFVSSDADSFTVDGVTATAGDTVEIVVAGGAGGVGVLTNPTTADSYELSVGIANATNDLGRTRVMIVDNVEVTAIVNTVFEFVVSGTATGTSINGETTTGSSTPTQIDFSTLIADTPEVLGQQLNVTTNARSGFVVTVEQSQDLQSAGGGVIDSFTNGTYVDSPTAWIEPGDDLLDELTWGHWGMTFTDGDLDGKGTNLTGTDQFIAASTSPRAIFAHDGPSDGLTGTTAADADDVGQSFVAYKIEITPLQEAGDDYNTTLTYIATPTF